MKKRNSYFSAKKIFWVVGGFLAAIIVATTLAQGASPSAQLFGESFVPAYTVPKKVFAKALAASLELPKGKKGKCYKDLKTKDETTPAICALKKAKVFTGGKTKAFFPEAKVNFGFAITSLCKAHKWTKKKTFSACTKYARKQGLLAPPLPAKIKSKGVMTYEQLASLMDRIAKPGEAAVKNTSQPAAVETKTAPNLPPRAPETMSFTPFPEESIDATFFADITLSMPIPNHFYKDEVYFFEGNVTGKTAEEVFVFLCPDAFGCDNSTNFLEKTSNGHFRIPVYFRTAGNFQLGIIPGRAGSSRVQNISVVAEPPAPGIIATAPTDLKIGYSEGKSVFRWSGEGSITQLVIFQGDKRKDYLFRQKINSFTPPAKDFKEFKKGKAGWLVKGAGAESRVQEITLTVQDFRKVSAEEIQIKSLQEIYPNPGTFAFEGKSLKPIAKKVAITFPNGQVKDIFLNGGDLPAQKDFSVEFRMETLGTYIFEVNNPEGAAVINVPIYVGEAVPLLPDFFATDEPELDTAAIQDLEESRRTMLALINKDRRDHSLKTLLLASDLNAVAQGHSRDMVDRNFFGHVNPSGLSPDDRRKNAGVPVGIRENLGKAAGLESVEAGLMRSPIHRAAIIDPDMTRVGIGIAKNAEGYFVITQNFSSDPIVSSALPPIENELFEFANGQRAVKNLSLLSHDQSLREIASEWSARMASKDFFSVTDPTNEEKLADIIRNRGINTSIQMHIVKTNQKDQLTEQVIKQAGLAEGLNRKVGIGLGVNNMGDLSLTVIYTP